MAKADLKQILSKLTTLDVKIDDKNNNFQVELNGIKNALNNIEKKMENAEKTAVEQERKRSIVLIGLPESTAAMPSARVKEDASVVENVLNLLGVESPFVSYRMGRFNPTGTGQRLVSYFCCINVSANFFD